MSSWTKFYKQLRTFGGQRPKIHTISCVILSMTELLIYKINPCRSLAQLHWHYIVSHSSSLYNNYKPFWSTHSSNYENYCILGRCDTVQSGYNLPLTPLKLGYIYTRFHGIISQKTIIFMKLPTSQSVLGTLHFTIDFYVTFSLSRTIKEFPLYNLLCIWYTHSQTLIFVCWSNIKLNLATSNMIQFQLRIQYTTKDEQIKKQCSHMHTRIEVMYIV
jgi:hypothetical protein